MITGELKNKIDELGAPLPRRNLFRRGRATGENDRDIDCI